MVVVVGLVLALLVAAAVLVMAVRSSAREGERPVGELVEAWRGRARSAEAPGDEAEATPVDVSLSEFLRANVEQGQAYLQVDDLAERLQRASEVTRRAIPGHAGSAGQPGA
ncbi:hypothetical protein ACTHAM_000408 [Cellulomonas soli]|uniref:hypothetical protein n=1 Tax=Cellulomonas soli TaxID=931535 RepID=UPI003F82EFA7